MSYDFFATRQEVERDVQDLYTRIQLLANDLADESAKKRALGQHLRLFQQQYASYVQSQLRQFSELLASDPTPAVGILPRGTAVLQFEMRLARPFLSKDDVPYHICDNPVRKEWVFRLPMMSATGWKGALRATAVRLLALEAKGLKAPAFAQKRFRLTQLFGNEKGLEEISTEEVYLDRVGGSKADRSYRDLLAQRTDSGFLAGRLRLYPTFFDKVTVEVINPHDRVKKAGKWPVYFESADIGASGTFTLLYIPFDLINMLKQRAYAEIAADLNTLGPALQAMLTRYGFGAKTSSGFGVAEDRLVEPGKLVLKVTGLPPEEPREPEPVKLKRRKKLRRYWKAENQLKDEFLTPEGEFVSEEQYKAHVESLGQEYAKPDQQLYGKARKWWERQGKALAEQQAEEPEPEPETAEPQWAERTFTSLGEMAERLEHLADALVEKGGGAP